MSLLVSLVIVGALAFSAYTGSRRGFTLIGLELISFFLAAVLAFTLYPHLGWLLQHFLHTSSAVSNVAAFILIWGVTEVACAIGIRFYLLPRLAHHIQPTLWRSVGGSAVNTLKTAAIITLGLVLYSGLPLPAATKQPVTDAFVAKQLIAASGGLSDKLARSLGRDLSNSLTFFTITSNPESEKRIDLGFTTANVSIDRSDETAMLGLLNRERTSRGLAALTVNDKARAVARAHSTDMFARGYFSHITPEGKTPFDRMRAGGVRFGSAGENLALAPSLTLAHTGLMNSPEHRDNILSPNYRAVGIGIIDGGQYGLMVTQDFTD